MADTQEKTLMRAFGKRVAELRRKRGMTQEQLKKDILDGKSITLCYPEYNIFSSAIVRVGSISIALRKSLRYQT